MHVKKLLPLVCLFLTIFFEIKSSAETEKKSIEDIMKQVERNFRERDLEWERKRTPLTLAAARGSVDEVKTLLENKADINEKDQEGKTALMLAATYPGHTSEGTQHKRDIVRYLLETNADVNAVDTEGKTALILSLSLWTDDFDDEVFKLILNANTDVTIKDNNGKTVVDYATGRWSGGVSVVELLAHVNVGDSQEKKDQWAVLVETARGIVQQDTKPWDRHDKQWGDIILESR